MDTMFGSVSRPTVEAAFKLAQRAVRAMETSMGGTEPKTEDKAPKLTVESIDNHVYFYADVDTDRCLAMIRNIREIDARLRNERETRSIPDSIAPTPIWLHIQSGGGSLYAGLAAADQLALIRTPVYSVAEGMCASAATLISVACRRRYILPSGFMLIHQFTDVHWGTYEQFKDEIKLQDMLIDVMKDFYSARTKMSKDKVAELLKHDSWFSAAQSVKLGLVDEVVGG